MPQKLQEIIYEEKGKTRLQEEEQFRLRLCFKLNLLREILYLFSITCVIMLFICRFTHWVDICRIYS